MFHERKSVTQLAREGERDANDQVIIVGHWRGVRGQSGKACAVWFGEYDTNPQTGERREKWVFLPVSQVERMENNRIGLPYWLANDKDLLVYEVKP